MIKINKRVNRLLEDISSTYLTKGVQPSEIADAIYEKAYCSIEMSKKSDSIQMIVSFQDEDEEVSSKIKMRYIYNFEKNLVRIEQKVNGLSYKIQWDRSSALELMISQLETELLQINDQSLVSQVLDTLPKEIYRIIKPRFKLVA
jgi:hypothetical protein